LLREDYFRIFSATFRTLGVTFSEYARQHLPTHSKGAEAMVKVMVVDDEPDAQILFQQQFRRELKSGVITFRFSLSGEEALKHLEEQGATDFVLILADINMPGMSGLELLKKIKEKYATLKVFTITAYGDDQNRQLAKQYGCDDYLTKPIDFGDLKKRILG